jgi:ABC-2 type transport system permease protein
MTVLDRVPWARIALYAARRMRFSPLAWGVPLGLLCLMIIAIFPSLEDSPELDKLIESYPDAFKQAFGVTDASFRTIEGYLAAEVFNLIAPLATAYFVIHALARAVCGSEQRGVLDVLLSAPLRRRQVLAGWMAGTAAVLLGILAVIAAICQAGALALGVGLSVGDTLAAVFNLWPLSLFFGGMTLLLAGLSGRTLAVTGTATAVLVGMYFVEVLGKLSDTVGAVDGLSAFHYYGSAIEDGIDPAGFVGLLAAGVVLAAVGCVLFERRDIRA